MLVFQFLDLGKNIHRKHQLPNSFYALKPEEFSCLFMLNLWSNRVGLLENYWEIDISLKMDSKVWKFV